MSVNQRHETFLIPALSLAVASPIIAELLSSNTPPLAFFIWWVFALFTFLYGSSCILVRELTVRWRSGWAGILALGVAFAILDEGILTRAFFDPNWHSLGPLAGHGRWLGMNVIWTLDALVFHALISIAAPIQLIHLLFPDSADKPWLRSRQLWIVTALLGLTTVVFIRAGNKYPVKPLVLTGCVVVMGFLCLLSRFRPVETLRYCRPVYQDRKRFFSLGFGSFAAILFQMYVVPGWLHSELITLAVLVGIIWTGTVLVRRWTANGDCWTAKQQFALTAGLLTALAITGGLQEINPSRSPRPTGMSVVSIASAGFLVAVRKRVGSAAADASAVTQTQRPLAMAAAVASSAVHRQSSYRSVAVAAAETEDHDATLDRTAEVPVLVRGFEIAVASCVLIITSPIMIILALLIRRDTPGPALFRQTRLGKYGSPFTFVKFRTLYADARQRFPHLYAYQYNHTELQSLKFKIVRDPRVTRQGEWMRKSTLDELPNFWNVLTGEMALVGPRPEIPEMLPYYTGYMKEKFLVRPGVTGLAQISGRGRLGFYETVDLDVQYVRTRSLALDLKILAMTAFKMTTRDGAF